MLLLILAVWYGYKKARDTGRNKFLWAAVSGGVFLGIQFGVGLAWGIFAVAAEQMWGSDLASGTAANLIVSVVAVVLSVIGLMLVFRFLDRLPDNAPMAPPPPPPNFDQNP